MHAMPLQHESADVRPDDDANEPGLPRSPGVSPAIIFGLPVLSLVAYLLSPPFMVSICHLTGVPWDRMRTTVYLPLVLLFDRVPGPWAMYYEGYCDFVITTLRLPVP